MKVKAKKIYWLLDKGNFTDEHIKKTKALREQKIVPTFLNDFGELFESYNSFRTSVVIIGDEFSEDDLVQGLTEISHHPELASTRFILSLSKPDILIVRKSIQHGFRDVIPLDLPDETWIQRFNFATSGSKIPYPQPVPQMTLKNISAVRVPARLVWVDANLLRIETKIKLEPGSKFKLMGGLADYLGVKWITVAVKEHQKTNLRYRFSDGYICQWRLPDSLYYKKQELLDNLMDHRVKAPHKAYVAISSYEIRQALINKLTSPLISINVALHKNSMTEEPGFLNPDIVFIEDTLTKGPNQPLFFEMLKKIRREVPIYIVGRDINQDYYKPWEQERGHEFVYLRKLSQNFSDMILRKLEMINPQRDIGSSFYIRKDHPLSFAEVTLSARLMKIHPDSVEFAVPYKISNFGIVAIESPIIKNVLNRNIYAKITSSFQGDSDINSFPYLMSGYLSDLMNEERIKLGERIIKVFTERMSRDLKILKGEHYLKENEISQINAAEPVREPAKEQEQSDEPQPQEMLQEMKTIASEEEAPLATPEPIKQEAPKGLENMIATLSKYKRDLSILAITVFVLSVIYILVFFVRPPVSEQGKVYSDQLLKFQQRFQKDR